MGCGAMTLFAVVLFAAVSAVLLDFGSVASSFRLSYYVDRVIMVIRVIMVCGVIGGYLLCAFVAVSCSGSNCYGLQGLQTCRVALAAERSFAACEGGAGGL